MVHRESHPAPLDALPELVAADLTLRTLGKSLVISTGVGGLPWSGLHPQGGN